MSVDRHRPNLVFRGFFDSSTFHHRLATSRSVVRVLPTRFHVLEGWFGPEGGQGMHGRAPNRRPFGGVVVETADKQHLLSPCNERTHVLDLMEGGWGSWRVGVGRGTQWEARRVGFWGETSRVGGRCGRQCPGRPPVGCGIRHDRANRGPTASHAPLCLCKWCAASMVNTRPLVQAPLLAETIPPLASVGG